MSISSGFKSNIEWEYLHHTTDIGLLLGTYLISKRLSVTQDIEFMKRQAFSDEWGSPFAARRLSVPRYLARFFYADVYDSESRDAICPAVVGTYLITRIFLDKLYLDHSVLWARVDFHCLATSWPDTLCR